METIPAVLDNRRIRSKRHNGEWWFAVEDVCGVLMDGPNGGACWRKLKRRLAKEGCEVGREEKRPHGYRTDIDAIFALLREETAAIANRQDV